MRRAVGLGGNARPELRKEMGYAITLGVDPYRASLVPGPCDGTHSEAR
jgi:hypothetical protein